MRSRSLEGLLVGSRGVIRPERQNDVVVSLRADLGFLRRGTRIALKLSAPANVRLLDAASAIVAQSGYPYLYFGGTYLAGLVKMTVPEDEHWVCSVDLEGLGETVSVSRVEVQQRRTARAWLAA